jgi:hypothetical protein
MFNFNTLHNWNMQQNATIKLELTLLLKIKENNDFEK